jgi:EAL domain-containing protein (putative c-di-GMP-specific phosphodiesterase class I)
VTLSRQLFLGIIAAFVALLVGIEAIYVWTAKENLEDQLDAHANETATSLALSLGARSRTLDASLVEIMVGPVFDRGHFDSIQVSGPAGERVFSRTLERREIEVPHWFVALVPIEGPTGEALISAGWTQLGKVVVQIHPGYAYKQLYGTALATLAWLTALFAVALVLVRYYLAGILKPLQAIEQTALAISERNFVSVGIEPRTRELQRVTAAMNSLSAKVRDAISHESERAERLRKEAFEDPLTGQLNLRGLEQSVGAKLTEGGEVYSGALALARGARPEELKPLAAALSSQGAHGTVIVGRWEDAALAAFIPNIDAAAALAWAEAVAKAFPAVALGLSHFQGDVPTLARMAAVAEAACAEGQKAGRPILSGVGAAAQGTGESLSKEIQSSIEAGRIALLAQKVMMIDGEDVLQVELLCTLSGADGRAIAAGAFVPVAGQHGLLGLLDIKVIGQALAALEGIASLPWTVSVNVSMQSIGDTAFRAALKALLETKKAVARRLIFEITGYAASRSPELAKAFAAELRGSGVRLALDNFDLDRNAMAIVHDLLPAYLKLAPAFTQQIAAREDLRFIVEAMVRMLRPLEIPLIAQGVEDANVIPVLERLGLAGYQGYAGGRPEPLPTG